MIYRLRRGTMSIASAEQDERGWKEEQFLLLCQKRGMTSEVSNVLFEKIFQCLNLLQVFPGNREPVLNLISLVQFTILVENVAVPRVRYNENSPPLTGEDSLSPPTISGVNHRRFIPPRH